MVDSHRLQKEFHKTEDARRFWNRLENPYLRSKEGRLAWLIAGKMPEGGENLLEIGCGEGSNFCYLQKHLPFVTFTGLDFSFEKVRFLSRFLNSVRAVGGDAARLPFADQQFDLIICRDLLHHIPFAKEQVMSEALRVLKSQGLIVIFESNGQKILSRLFRFFFPVERGMKESTPEKLKTLGEHFGSVKIEFVEGSFLLRALAFFIGWPRGIVKFLFSPLYCLAHAWEKIFEYFAPKRMWTYMMMSLRRY